eukprot:NODE_459_length_3026_cov_8.827182.p1 GENE.NODE_459_length_3026_cov_8.827182~~NODE_459_length_3026_cov_8.827182.p1  ORF type:complete len:900 (+),score=172.48 NODE_459_length_3026_cov_8.827182:320-2701(+)
MLYTWPQCLKVRREYAVGCTETDADHIDVLPGMVDVPDVLQSIPEEQEKRNSRCILNPDSNAHLFFNVSSLCVLLYDLSALPFVLAWDVPFQGYQKIATYLTLCYWCLDMCITFRTGFYINLKREMRPWPIAVRYMRGFFAIDCLVIISDTATIVINVLATDHAAIFESMNVARVPKIGRLLKVVRVLRLVRVRETVIRIVESGHMWRGSLQIGGILCVIIWLNHVIACMWYAIGRYGDGMGLTWLHSIAFGDETYENSSTTYQYFTAFHWSLTQMTPGSMQVMPVNTVERIFNVLCLMSGLIIFSSLVSMLSSKLTAARVLQADSTRERRELDAFLCREGVDSRYRMLALHVQKLTANSWVRQKPSTMNDLTAIKKLPRGVQDELKYEVCFARLKTHPFLTVCSWADSAAIRHLIDNSLNFTSLAQADNLFIAGKESPGAMYHITRGRVVYTQEPSTSLLSTTRSITVPQSGWLCEASMWCYWTHVGTSVCVVGCEFFVLTHDGITGAGNHSPGLKIATREYARAFHARLKEAAPPHAPWPDDTQVAYTSIGEIAPALSSQVRKLFNTMAVQQLTKGPRQLPISLLRGLSDEAQKGKAVLTIGPYGQVQRNVSLMILMPAWSDDRFLAQVGEWYPPTTSGSGERGVVREGCRLIRSKMLLSESPAECFRRVSQGGWLGPLTDCLALDHVEVMRVTKCSLRFMTDTVYTRYVHVCQFQKIPQFEVVKTGARDGSGPWAGNDIIAMRSADGTHVALCMLLTVKEFQTLNVPSAVPLLRQILHDVHIEAERPVTL